MKPRTRTRRRAIALALCMAVAPSVSGADSGASAPPWLPRTRQLIVVRAAGWNATAAPLRRYSRAATGGWQPVGDPIQVVLGRGLGWGVGLHSSSLARGGAPEKKEGDGRSPAGAFRLGEATGYPSALPAGATWPYRRASPRLFCVDDPASPLYNQLAERPTTGEPPWKSSEPMLRSDDLYLRTVFVAHNPSGVAGAGSCIFLHVWRGPDRPTVGCTAMALPSLEELIAWLRPEREPVLVQLPEAEYARLASAWGLPRWR